LFCFLSYSSKPPIPLNFGGRARPCDFMVARMNMISPLATVSFPTGYRSRFAFFKNAPSPLPAEKVPARPSFSFESRYVIVLFLNPLIPCVRSPPFCRCVHTIFLKEYVFLAGLQLPSLIRHRFSDLPSVLASPGFFFPSPRS